ncbi:MAG: hypothetical protein ACOCQR_01795 [bacterium]
MIMTLLGSILILGSGWIIGSIINNVFINRIQQLRDFRFILNLFNDEIAYSQTPLPTILKRVSKKANYPLSGIFKETYQRLEKNNGELFSDIWSAMLKENNELMLTEGDIEILIQWGEQIGSSPIEGQKKINNIAIKNLQEIEENIREETKTNVKLIRYASVLGSLAIVIYFL